MRSAFHWTLWSGPTPSVDTGPSKAFNGHYYLYVESDTGPSKAFNGHYYLYVESDTGPSKAFNGHYYLYVESSRPSIQGDMAEYIYTSVIVFTGVRT